MPKLISNIILEKDKITLEPDPQLTKYVKDPLWIKCKEINMKECPEALASIPLVLNLAPIVWRLGGIWEDLKIDKNINNSLDLARRSISKIYKEYSFSGTIVGQGNVPNKNTNGSLILYSGGVDSTFTVMNKFKENPLLLSINADTTKRVTTDSSNTLKGYNSLRKKIPLERLVIESNFGTFLNQENIKNLFPGLTRSYWAAIQHGLGLSGLAAPILYLLNKHELIISGGHSVGQKGGAGSHPFLEGQLKWTNSFVNHYGYQFSKFEKIENIDKISRELKLKPRITVCTRANTITNCLTCEKCLRTLANILIADLEPADYGFEINKDDAINHLKIHVPHKIYLGQNEFAAWETVKFDALSQKNYGKNNKFLDWVIRLKLYNSPFKIFKSFIKRVYKYKILKIIAKN